MAEIYFDKRDQKHEQMVEEIRIRIESLPVGLFQGVNFEVISKVMEKGSRQETPKRKDDTEPYGDDWQGF